MPLGTMTHDSAECFPGVLMTQDIVVGIEQQRQKKNCHSDPDSFAQATMCPPKKPKMGAHTVEVLRQVETAAAPPATGGWVGGDAWFRIGASWMFWSSQHLNRKEQQCIPPHGSIV